MTRLPRAMSNFLPPAPRVTFVTNDSGAKLLYIARCRVAAEAEQQPARDCAVARPVYLPLITQGYV